MLLVNDEGREWGLEIGFGSVWLSAWRWAERERPEGSVPRTLFDNFIGRKRDVDGGVLAGLFGATALERPKRQLTVTFQTTILFGSGLVQRRETVGRMAI